MGDLILDAVSKTALTGCEILNRVTEQVCVWVAFTYDEMDKLGQGGLMVEIPRQMEAMISEEFKGERWLGDTFFKDITTEDVGEIRVFTYEGYASKWKRNMLPMYEMMKGMGIKLPGR